MVEQGLLLIIDEIQNIKNESSQTDACRALVHSVLKSKTSKSFMLMLSGSPFDKPEHCTAFYRTMGIVTEPKLAEYNPHSKEVVWMGMTQIINHAVQCCMQDKEKLSKVTELVRTLQSDVYGVTGDINRRTFPTNPSVALFGSQAMHKLAYDLLLLTFLPEIAYFMVRPEEHLLGTTLDVYNGMYEVDFEALRSIMNAVDRLRTHVGALAREGGQAREEGLMAAIQKRLFEIECAKVDLFIRLAGNALEDKSQGPRKVVLALNFLGPIAQVAEALAKYNPLIVTGGVPQRERKRRLDKFQSKELEHRLLIGSLSIISTGIDLDNQHDRVPRVCFASPGWRAMLFYQLTYRFRRSQTTSDAQINIVYAKQCPETRVLDVLEKRGKVMRSIVEMQKLDSIKFPSEYAEYVENPDVPMLNNTGAGDEKEEKKEEEGDEKSQ